MKSALILASLLLSSASAVALTKGKYDCTPKGQERPVTLKVIDDEHLNWSDERTSASSVGKMIYVGPMDEYGTVGAMLFELTDFFSDKKTFFGLEITLTPASKPGLLEVTVGQYSQVSLYPIDSQEAFSCQLIK